MVISSQNVVIINCRRITTHIHYLFGLPHKTYDCCKAIRSQFTSLNTQRRIVVSLPKYRRISNSIILDNCVTQHSLLIQRSIIVSLPEYIRSRNSIVLDNCVNICQKINFSYVYSASNKNWVQAYNSCKDVLFWNLNMNYG